jgi:hemoglobin
MKTKQLITIMILSIFLSNCSNKKPEDKMAIEETIAIVEEVSIEASLFSRLGGEEGISAIVDDIVKAHLVNPEIKQVFMPLANDPARLESFKTHVKEFLSAGTGGGATYTGKDLPTAHKGLNTTEKEFLSATDDILLVLSNHGIDEETKKDMLYILYSMKGAVIGK